MHPTRDQSPGIIVFYDGSCGLCHATVRFALTHERPRAGEGMRFAPLGGATANARLPPHLRDRRDSMIVLRPDGSVAQRSDSTIEIASRLKAPWRWLAVSGRWTPRPIRDAMYKVVARTRRWWFRNPDAACPAVPPELRDRFLP